MKCPKCESVDLVPEAQTGAGSARYGCPACGGVWRPAPPSVANGGPRGADVPAHALVMPSLLCPCCRVGLFEYCVAGTQVLVDGCRTCRGTWLDAGEATMIDAAREPGAGITCPKCQAIQSSSTQCTRCGVFIAKFLEMRQQRDARASARARQIGELFDQARSFRIDQRVEWLEILSPFELANRYEVMIQGRGNRFGVVTERSDSWFNLIGRQLLGALRPARLSFENVQNEVVLNMDKPLRLYFHRIDLSDANGVRLGSVERRFHLLRENYAVMDRHGRPLIQIVGPLFFLPFIDPVFRFVKNGSEVGRLTKRWKGLLRESFSDGDGFDTDIDPSLSVTERVLLFGAVFLIDFGSFEDNQGD